MRLGPSPLRRLPRARVYSRGLGDALTFLRHLPTGAAHGPVARSFELALAAELGAPHAFALPHARVALRMLLRALDLPRGSEVALTPVTIPDMVNVILDAGLVPIFVDLGERTANIDCSDLERKLTPRTRALLLTHLCGLPSDMDRLVAIAERHGLTVLEDCSQAMGATWRGAPLGLFGRAGFFSLTTLKPLSTWCGGVTITRDAGLDQALRALAADLPAPDRTRLAKLLVRDQVLDVATRPLVFSALTHHAVRAAEALRPGLVEEVQRGNLVPWREGHEKPTRRAGLPAWMLTQYSDCQAAVGLRALATLADGNRRRRELSFRLLALLEEQGVPGLPRLLDPGGSTFWRFPLWINDVHGLRRSLRRRFIDCAGTNMPCLSREPAFAEHGHDTPHAARYVDHMVFLPMHPSLTDADLRHVARAVGDFHRGGGA